ncbi:MAG: tagaturonate reductase, partial [Saprospiraceae bacterium]|nr:tagaturonate reductase [Saprospiraceae bacterium]
AELVKFAEEVFDRFRNPFIKHMLSSIALNSISKFKVRVLPSLLEYVNLHGKLPLHLTYAFACLIRFYQGTWQGKSLPLDDDQEIISFFASIWATGDYDEISSTVLARHDYWGQDLNQVTGLTAAMAAALQEIDAEGIQEGFARFKNEL